MQSLSEKVLRLGPPGGVFDTSVVRYLFPDASEGARKLLVYRSIEKKEIARLKPGIYILEKPFRKVDPHPFVLAAMLHAPSHVSLESALAYHDLIPEAVYQVSSVTSGRSRTYHTPFGVFSFQRVPAADPRAGVKALEMHKESWAFVAEPLRAIADLIYLTPDITWEKDGISFLIESMRIEEDDLRTVPLDACDEISHSIRSRRTRTYLNGLRRTLSL